MKLHGELNYGKLIGEVRGLVKRMIHHIHKMYSPFSLLELANFKSSELHKIFNICYNEVKPKQLQ